MPELSATLIDVGWGDSIFLEFADNADKKFALIDSNDSTYEQPTYMYIKKFLRRNNIKYGGGNKPLFEFILLTHPHSDHAQGLSRIITEFGAKHFLYAKSLNWNAAAFLLRLHKTASRHITTHESLHTGKTMGPFNNTNISVLWPDSDFIDHTNENNNSVVLLLTLGETSFILSGDAEESVWKNIRDKIPNNTRFFKVPHHGSKYGALSSNTTSLWLSNLDQKTLLGISAHKYGNFNHPDPSVLQLFTANNFTYYRTDEQFHLTFKTDGQNISVKYSHI